MGCLVIYKIRYNIDASLDCIILLSTFAEKKHEPEYDEETEEEMELENEADSELNFHVRLLSLLLA